MAPKRQHMAPLPPEVLTLLKNVYPVIILNTVAVGMTWPAIPAILLEAMDNDVASVALFLTKAAAYNSMLDFVTNPILGSLSDTFGRRFFLLQSLCWASISNIIVAVYASPNSVLVSKIIFGFTNVTKAMGYSMLCDALATSNADRAVRVRAFGLIGTAIGSGCKLVLKSMLTPMFSASSFFSRSFLFFSRSVAIGPLVGGVIGLHSPVTTTLASAFVTAATAILVRCWLQAEPKSKV